MARIKKPELVVELSKLLNADPHFHPTIMLSMSQVEVILDDLKNYKRPENFQHKGKRPEIPGEYACERTTNYRHNMSEYIEENTGIKLFVSPSVPARFYTLIADYLGL